MPKTKYYIPSAERARFELARLSPASFQDWCVRPLHHLSALEITQRSVRESNPRIEVLQTPAFPLRQRILLNQPIPPSNFTKELSKRDGESRKKGEAYCSGFPIWSGMTR